MIVTGRAAYRAATSAVPACAALTASVRAQDWIDCDCGAEGEPPCRVRDVCYGRQRGGATGCDRALRLAPDFACDRCLFPPPDLTDLSICGCDYWCPAPFQDTCCIPEVCIGEGQCRIPWNQWRKRLLCYDCVDQSRRDPRVDDFMGTWTWWALAEQRALAANEPVNWVMHLAAHNAFNNRADGYPFPNQRYSITDALRVGARDIMLDAHGLQTGVRLSHGTYFDETGDTCVGCNPFRDRLYVYAIREIARWLEDNPDEVIMIQIEDYNIDEARGNVDDFLMPLEKYLGDWMLRTSEKPEGRWPSENEMLNMDPPRRVILLPQGYDDAKYLFDGSWTGPFKYSFSDSAAKDFDGDSCSSGSQSFVLADDKFSEVSEDRSPLSLFAVVGHLCTDDDDGLVTPCTDIAHLAECNINFIGTDMILNSEGIFGEADARLRRLVWSWEEDAFLEPAEAAKLVGATGRWVSDTPGMRHHVACAKPRTGDPLMWEDPVGTQWGVTLAIGSWDQGEAMCQTEFANEGYVFSVPVSGYMNRHLKAALATARNDPSWDSTSDDVWLNYRD